jgi:hypothetical protein
MVKCEFYRDCKGYHRDNRVCHVDGGGVECGKWRERKQLEVKD